MSVSELLKRALERIEDLEGFDRVGFIIHYGSSVIGGIGDASDIDLAVYFDGDDRERFNFRKRLLGRLDDVFDVQIFQDLPLYVQREAVSEGRVVFLKDFQEVFEVFMKVIREFDDFKPHLDLYYSCMEV